MRKLEEIYVTSCGEVFYDGLIVKQCLSGSHGYATVYVDGKNQLVHRLVAERWIPNPEGKRTVNHKDGNKRNNKIENLEWSTDSENNQHAFDNLGRKPSRGRMLVSDLDAKRILDLKGLLTQRQIAEIFDVKRSLVADIHTGRRKINVT